MLSRHRLAEVAALVADPSRAGMLAALWDGCARPAGELARLAGISPATASTHLARLLGSGLVLGGRSSVSPPTDGEAGRPKADWAAANGARGPAPGCACARATNGVEREEEGRRLRGEVTRRSGGGPATSNRTQSA
jgi:DNA-binding transcriptional ArsR family regulator